MHANCVGSIKRALMESTFFKLITLMVTIKIGNVQTYVAYVPIVTHFIAKSSCSMVVDTLET